MLGILALRQCKVNGVSFFSEQRECFHIIILDYLSVLSKNYSEFFFTFGIFFINCLLLVRQQNEFFFFTIVL